MNKTINIWRLFVCFAHQAQGAPLVDRAVTVERDGKQRTGNGFLIRAPFAGRRPSKGLVIGLWRKQGGAPAGPTVGA